MSMGVISPENCSLKHKSLVSIFKVAKHSYTEHAQVHIRKENLQPPNSFRSQQHHLPFMIMLNSAIIILMVWNLPDGTVLVWDDILTPTIFWPWSQNILTIFWPPDDISTPLPKNQFTFFRKSPSWNSPLPIVSRTRRYAITKWLPSLLHWKCTVTSRKTQQISGPRGGSVSTWEL